MEDAAGFFANVFGGERFNDYVRLFSRLHFFFTFPHWYLLLDWRNLHNEGHDLHGYDDDDGGGKS